jgi:recombination protein RecA
MSSPAALLRSQIEVRLPSAFSQYRRQEHASIATGIAPMDELTKGIPLHSLTEICGSALASSGKTSVLMTLLGRASEEHSCALVDASDAFDPASAHAAGVNLAHLLWVRCGTNQQKWRPLEQAFKVTDMLLESGGFGLIAVDLSGISEKLVRKVPLSTWFRFSRVVEQQATALVFLERQPHATSCAGLVLRLSSEPAAFSGKLLTQFTVTAELVRTREKKGAPSATPDFSIRAQWA